MTEKTMNLRGLKCPLPALRVRKMLSGLAAGDVIVAECTDPLTEIDGAISWRSRLRGDVGYELGAQAGRLFPGNAFQMADGSRLGPVNAVRFRATLVF